MTDQGVLLEDLTWIEAEPILSPDTIIIIPIGAAAKEHGPHLQLSNDWLMVEYYKRRLLALVNVVVAPTVGYHYYPAFLEYPGSISLRLETARDLVIDICNSLAGHGPRRFYALNTGVSTLQALTPAASQLAATGILLHYTDILAAARDVEQEIAEQEGGTHADELETSKMLYIAPETVQVQKARRDYHPGGKGLTRDPAGEGCYSATGIFGDATLATRAKGERLVETTLRSLIRDIEQLRAAPLPPVGRGQ